MTGWPMLFLTHAIADTTAARGFRRILPDRDPRGRQCTTRDSSRARRSATSSAFGSPRSTGGSGPDDSPPRCASAKGRCAGASRKSPAGSSRLKDPNPRPRDKSRAAALGSGYPQPSRVDAWSGDMRAGIGTEEGTPRGVPAIHIAILPTPASARKPSSPVVPHGPLRRLQTRLRDPLGRLTPQRARLGGLASPNPRNSIPTFRR